MVAFYICLFLFWTTAAPLAFARDSSSTEEAAAHDNLTQLVRQVIQHEIHMQLTDNSLWCFREQKQDDGKAVKDMEVCQSPDGDIERLLALNGHQLSASQLQAEDQRIQKLIAHPEQLRARQKKQREDAEQVRSLLKIFPDAFHFQYVSSDGNLTKLNFKPNPAFHAANRAAYVFHHLEGTVILDVKQKRLAEINGTLTSEVKFGGGFLGHLDKGGTFVVKSGNVAPGHWDTTLMDVQMNGRALFFKTITIHDRETYQDYTPVPHGATLQQVAELLRKESTHIHAASNGYKY